MRKKLLFTSVILLSVLLVVSIWLLGTQSGLNTVMSVAKHSVPGLEISQARGRLISHVALKGLQYRPDNATGVDIDDLTLYWQASALLRGTLRIASVNVRGVTVHTVAAEAAKTDASLTPPDIQLPLQIEVASAVIEDVSVMDDTGVKTQLINRLDTQVTAERKQLKISHFQVDTNDVNAALKGQLALSPPYQSAFDYHVKTKQLFSAEVTLDGQLTGNTDQLKIEQTLSAPLASTQRMTVSDVLHELNWSLEAKAAQLNLADVFPEQETQITNLAVTAEGDLASLNAAIQTDVKQPDLPKMAIQADIRSDDFKTWLLKLNTAISEQQQLQVNGSVDIHGDEPIADLNAAWQNLAWPLEADVATISSPQGQLTVKGSLDDYQASLRSALDWQDETIDLTADTTGSLTQLTLETLNIAAFGGQLDANGQIDWQNSPLQYQLKGEWQGMTLPKQLTQQLVKLKQGNISINGDSEQLSLMTQTDLVIDEQSASLAAQASGHTETGFEESELTVKLADGELNYQGPVLWAGTTLLDGKLTVKQFNPGILAAEWPGLLNGDATIKLDNPPAGIQAQIRDIAITGDLRQRPVKLSGDVSYSDKLIEVSTLKLLSGDSSLTASGQLVEDKSDFKWSVQSADLIDFYPNLKGALNARGQVTGTLKTPTINADIEASNIQFEDIKLGTLKGQTRLELTENAELNTEVDITDLTLPQLDAESLKLRIQGKQNAHQIDLALVSDALTLTMQADGGLDRNQQWQGHFKQFDFSNEQAGQWQLSEKGDIQLAAESQNVPKHCWSSSNGHFCFEATHKGNEWQTAGNFEKLPLSLFEGFAVELEQLQGTLRGQFKLAADSDAVMTGDGNVYLDDASVQLNQSALNQQKPIQLNNVELNYQLDASKTVASFHLEPQLDGVSAINAELETADINTLSASPEQAALKGNITTAIKDLSALELTHPAFTDLKGQLDVDLRLDGTVAQPKIDGTASLEQGQVAIVDAGIVLKQIQANIRGDMQQVDFDLAAQSGEGSLKGKGQFKLNDSSWQLLTDLKGEQFELMNTPEALVIAEPDLTISVTPEKTLVKGKVHIPEAELEPREFNSTVSPSKDVIVVSDVQEKTGSGPVTELDITVSLADKVKLQAMGFQGRLTGELRVFGQTSDVLLGNGEIKIKDGSYVAYGQLLHVDNGSIRFAGPIDNPELDLKAVRKGKDYEAGLHIEGFAASPQATLFSDPDMTQDNILSYILLGKPVQQASATDAALLASAATGMGLQNGAMIGDQIASTFGLDEFSIQGDSAENAAVQVGKYLSPKLYLSYGIGVFDSVSTVELRYQLSKIWALKAESGTESGVDLLYTYERGGPKD